jgi:hypothetical protein
MEEEMNLFVKIVLSIVCGAAIFSLVEMLSENIHQMQIAYKGFIFLAIIVAVFFFEILFRRLIEKKLKKR